MKAIVRDLDNGSIERYLLESDVQDYLEELNGRISVTTRAIAQYIDATETVLEAWDKVKGKNPLDIVAYAELSAAIASMANLAIAALELRHDG